MALRWSDVRVDGSVGLKVEVDLLLLSLVGEDGSDVEDETVGRHSVVQLETRLGGTGTTSPFQRPLERWTARME